MFDCGNFCMAKWETGHSYSEDFINRMQQVYEECFSCKYYFNVYYKYLLYLTAIMPASTQLKELNPAEALYESTGRQTITLHSRRGLQVSITETKNQPRR